MIRTRVLAHLVAPLVTVVPLTLTACGGGNTDEPGALSKSQFENKANGLCSGARAKRTPLLQQQPANPSGPADAQNLRSIASIDRELIRRVDALVPPESEQDQVDRVLDAWRRRAGVEDQYAAAVGAMQGPQTLATFTASLTQIDATADPIATQLGMTQCTRGAP